MHKQTTYQLLPNAALFLNDLEAEIARAAISFDAQFYTFEADGAGLPIARALIAARGRGVRVRLMVDNSINIMHNDYYIRVPRLNRQLHRTVGDEWRATTQLLADMQAAGVQIKLIRPLGFLQHKAFWRDHKKLVAIDTEDPAKATAYIGGINPSDHNASWNDFMVKMRGDAVPLIKQELNRTWRGRYKAGAQAFSDGQLITDARGESRIMPCAWQLIRNARTRVILESPYLWGKATVRELTAAARRNVQVAIIVPARNNKKIFILPEQTLARLERSGIAVYRFAAGNGMTHAKALLADNYAMFGSSNFNAFLTGKIAEANIVTSNPSIVRQLEQFLADSIAASNPQHV